MDLEGPIVSSFFAWSLGLDKILPQKSNHQTYNIELPLAIARVQTHLSNKHNLVLYIDSACNESDTEQINAPCTAKFYWF